MQTRNNNSESLKNAFNSGKTEITIYMPKGEQIIDLIKALFDNLIQVKKPMTIIFERATDRFITSLNEKLSSVLTLSWINSKHTFLFKRTHLGVITTVEPIQCTGITALYNFFAQIPSSTVLPFSISLDKVRYGRPVKQLKYFEVGNINDFFKELPCFGGNPLVKNPNDMTIEFNKKIKDYCINEKDKKLKEITGSGVTEKPPLPPNAHSQETTTLNT